MIGDRFEAVGPGVVRRQPRRHREQVAQRRGGPVVRRHESRRLGHVAAHLVVEREQAAIAQEQDRRRDEALRHRGDAEDGVRAGWRLRADAERASAARVDQVTVEQHAVGKARRLRRAGVRVAGDGKAREDLVDGGDEVGRKDAHRGSTMARVSAIRVTNVR
jgi:hypothetical protein